MKNFYRTLMALVISISGILLSYKILYPNTQRESSSKKNKPTAKIILATNDVKRQGADRIIWEPVRHGDLLFLGDKLKTSALSNSKIEFLDNGAKIDIEPESLIVITQNNKKLSLQVMEGSLFVSSNKDISNMILSSGNGPEKSVNLKNGDFAFSVNKDGKSVLESINDKNNLGDKFKNLKPSYGDTLYIDNKANENIVFKFSPISENYEIKLELGISRSDMGTINEIQSDVASGQVKINPIIGTYYWRLKAINKDNPVDSFYSSTIKTTFKQKIPPNIISPLANDLIQIKNNKEPIEFKWSIAHAYEKVELEIKNADDKKPILLEDVTNQTFFTTNKISKPGHYSWKLIGHLNENSNTLSSNENNFNIMIGEELQSPLINYPEDHAILFAKNTNDNYLSNIKLSWKAVKDAKEYLLTITNKDNQKREIRVINNEFNIPKLNTGNYSWYVQSINDKNETSKKISPKTFNISQLSPLKFVNLPPNIYYTTSFPTIKIQWNKIDQDATYRLKISQSQSMSPSEILTTKDSFFNYQIGREGKYYLTVEAINTSDIIFANSEMATLFISKPPLPPAPIFLNANKNWESNLNGDINIEIANYNNKLQVLFELLDSKGNIIDQSRQNANNTSFHSLNPGNYYVTAKFIDEFNQSSESGQRKLFTVPDRSAINAPKIKGVKIR